MNRAGKVLRIPDDVQGLTAMLERRRAMGIEVFPAMAAVARQQLVEHEVGAEAAD